jgi:hypothetical protein
MGLAHAAFALYYLRMTDEHKPDKPAKPAKPKVTYQHRITSNDATCLHTLAGVRTEMARVYRLALNRHVSGQEGARFIYMLTQIRDTLEMINHEPLQLPPPQQLESPTINIIAVPPDHYLSADQVRAIRESEYRAAYGNGHANGHANDDENGKLN